jgi:hypothetical protein
MRAPRLSLDSGSGASRRPGMTEWKCAAELFISSPAMQTAAHALTQQFLAWIEEAPRSYADAEAWRRSCPHLSIWEDAISGGLVRFKNGASMQQSRLVLTPRGRAWLKRP